ncbi:serine/threonine-protein kinase [Paractinoplanes globisporus]|uniref:non-specific serine/threonine protein kinase n=1 Tax=Paractinoplanes globisporus TaxID=113565 RepID=A0ABW6WAS7_9ACTN|nr:serine/threonine-protein kinase [Actinoplanes globisporus]
MALPGDVLGDRYRLDDRIAAGGMGEVWRATDTVLGRDVAVKTLHAGRAGDAGFQTRFKHEARAMAVLHHPGVADVYDYGQSGPDAYIVMARVEGEALNQRIAARGRLTPAETMSIVAQAGRALDAAHREGIVHRDVKPGNLIIKPDGTVVLVDFGVARSAESAALTGAKEVVGTALYIAPEQVSKEITGPPADVYALGVVAYHCLAGHPPFLGDSPIAVALQHVRDDPPPLPPDVPAPVKAVVETAMAKDPQARFSSAAAMAAAAELASAGTGTTAILAATGETATMIARPSAPVGSGTAVLPAVEPLGGPPGGPPGNRRRNILLGAAAAVVLGALGTVLALANLGGHPAAPPAHGTSVSPAAPAGTGKATKKNTTRPADQGATTTKPPTRNTTTPTPSRTTTTEPTTTAPEQTATTTAPGPDVTVTVTVPAGDNSGPGGGNQGPGGG